MFSRWLLIRARHGRKAHPVRHADMCYVLRVPKDGGALEVEPKSGARDGKVWLFVASWAGSWPSPGCEQQEHQWVFPGGVISICLRCNLGEESGVVKG